MVLKVISTVRSKIKIPISVSTVFCCSKMFHCRCGILLQCHHVVPYTHKTLFPYSELSTVMQRVQIPQRLLATPSSPLIPRRLNFCLNFFLPRNDRQLSWYRLSKDNPPPSHSSNPSPLSSPTSNSDRSSFYSPH